MNITHEVSLKSFNTFGIDVKARDFISFETTDELIETFESFPSLRNEKRLVLGGGSNILLSRDFDGYVLKNNIVGVNLIKEDDEFVWLKAGAGVPWHELVLFAVNKGWGGIENMSLIPGSCGAAPMQNIGAYGVELKDVFHTLEAYHIQDNSSVIFAHKDCAFGYRESVFKHRYSNQFVITSITLRLHKNPNYQISYGAIRQELDNMQIKELSVKAISDAVIRIRSSKLPDPTKVGNAGSFFKNPSISKEEHDRLKNAYPNLVSFANTTDGTYKLAAGWLIEQCGWKGYRKGDAGCYPLQALVLVNYGNATGSEILALSEEIQSSVIKKFDVKLEREVNLIS
jgi:UDP-N-acetylmuramate dehydrogenase